MLEVIKRRPDFKVVVERPNFNSVTYSASPIVIFTTSASTSPPDKAVISTSLQSYSFKETLGDPTESTFMLSTTMEQDEDKLTWFDKLHVYDLVSIEELGEIRFVGVIQSVDTRSRIGDDGAVTRSVEIAGISLGALLATFKLIIDQFLYVGTTIEQAANQKLKAALIQQMESGASVAPILKAIYDSFFELALEMGLVNSGGKGIKAILDHFIDFSTKLSSDVVMHYPIALSIYGRGENDIWTILENLIVPPLNELFMLWNSSTAKYEAVYRQTPFEPADWTSLKSTEIPAVLLTEYGWQKSSDEVYTYYLAILEGSGIGQQLAMLLDSEGYGQMAVKDDEKWPLYGYRPMIIHFKYFNKDKEEEYASAAQTMLSLSQMLYRWFRYNDEFLSGTITLQTIDNRQWTGGTVHNPRVGEKIKFLGGEFYIEGSTHSWSYMDSFTTRLDVSRGFRYSEDGNLLSPISNVGIKLRAIEQGKDNLSERGEGR